MYSLNIKFIFLLIVLIPNLILSSACQAGMQEAFTAMKDGDFEKAISEIKPLANSGDAEAQYYLGAMSSEGKGVTQSHSDSTIWFAKAAEQNHPVAQYNLANCYARGLGVEKNSEKALYWHKKSAENGFAYAQTT